MQKVTLIEGTFFKWMDWHGSLIFKTDKNIVNEIVKDYDNIDKDQLEKYYFDAEIMNNPDIMFYHKEVKLDDKMYETTRSSKDYLSLPGLGLIARIKSRY